MRTAVILPHVEKPIPFGHLHQLDQVGISTIIILLNAEEFKTAKETKFSIFDNTEPKTIIEHYQSQSARFKIEVINTQKATTEEEKLSFYLKHATEQYQLNLFLCHESMPWVNEELSAKPPSTQLINYSFLNFPVYTSGYDKEFPLSQSPNSSDQIIKLLQHDSNPCLCYKMAKFDLLNYQWLFNIFVELINIKAKSHEEFIPEISSELNNIINNFNRNIIDLKKAETAYENTHKKMYSTNNEPYTYTKWQHANNINYKENIENRFPALIREMITLYAALAQNDLHNFRRECSSNYVSIRLSQIQI